MNEKLNEFMQVAGEIADILASQEYKDEIGQRYMIIAPEIDVDLARIFIQRFPSFKGAIETAEKENAELRDAFEWATRQVWEGCDIDGGGFQDEMVKRGLLVEVPADDAFIEEFDAEFMYVLRWSPLAASYQKEIHE